MAINQPNTPTAAHQDDPSGYGRMPQPNRSDDSVDNVLRYVQNDSPDDRGTASGVDIVSSPEKPRR